MGAARRSKAIEGLCRGNDTSDCSAAQQALQRSDVSYQCSAVKYQTEYMIKTHRQREIQTTTERVVNLPIVLVMNSSF